MSVIVACESAVKVTMRILHWTLTLTPTLEWETVAPATALWSQPKCMQNC